jgi:uncharacterized membrane protein
MLQRKQLAALAERDTNRLEAFSDGVFAIAITLLVLNIHIPDAAGKGDLGQALRDQWPSYLAYLLSFLTILNLWVNHHNTFTEIVAQKPRACIPGRKRRPTALADAACMWYTS